MFQKIKFIALCAGLALLLNACYKDLGNYQYKGVNTITAGLSGSYYAKAGDTLIINPTIQLSMDDSTASYDTTKYGYQWILRNYNLTTFGETVLSTQRNMYMVVGGIVPRNDYSLVYKITDKKTGVATEFTANLAVTTNFNEGWLALCDVNGQSRLDMIRCDTGLYHGKFIPNASGGNGLDMSGKAMDVAYVANASLLTSATANGIYISTANTTSRIQPDYFTWDPTMNIRFDMQSNVPASYAADMIRGCNGGVNFLHTADGSMYAYVKSYQFKWSVPVNVYSSSAGPLANTLFNAAPYVAMDAANGSNYGAIIFDATGKQWLNYSPTSPVTLKACSPIAVKDSLYPWKIGMDLLYMEYNRIPGGAANTGGEVFSVLKNASTGVYVAAAFNFGNGGSNVYKQTYYDTLQSKTITKATDFALAEHYAVSPDYGHIYYSVGSKLYAYDRGLKQSFLIKDYGAKKISYISFHQFQLDKYNTGLNRVIVKPPSTYGFVPFTQLYNKLIVGSYDPAAAPESCGTFELFTTPGILQSGAALTPYLSVSGLGKIVSVTYRER
jgi:hypothetical protein